MKPPGIIATVHITNKTTVETRLYNDEWLSEYIWAEGNFSCDCNRSLFFARAGGEDDPNETQCGVGKYSVRIVDDSGRLLYED